MEYPSRRVLGTVIWHGKCVVLRMVALLQSVLTASLLQRGQVGAGLDLRNTKVLGWSPAGSCHMPHAGVFWFGFFSASVLP